MSHNGIIGFIHDFNRNIVVLVVTNNSAELKLLASNKVNKGSGVTGCDLSNCIVEGDVEKIRLLDDPAIFEMYKALFFGVQVF